ncbi:universal stress protein [Microlunatus aurantiacus]|uniref:Universal stress protein n=1 Tax=Microlunatus aurantiacus TaxID=446786 RepID=A0ABP7CQF8_9ACTN
MTGIRSHVLVGYIPTPEGIAALDYAIAYAEQNEARLTVVNTAKDGDYAHPQFATAEDVDTIDDLLATRKVEHTIVRPTDGKPAAEAILDTAAEVGADTIVIGVRRRSPVGKMLTGSTAQAIILRADCPVIAVKPQP